MDGTANHMNHQNLVEQISDEIRRLENDNWAIHFNWMKAHNDSNGNKLADRLAKEAVSEVKQKLPTTKSRKAH
jgi:ribonuclease HI